MMIQKPLALWVTPLWDSLDHCCAQSHEKRSVHLKNLLPVAIGPRARFTEQKPWALHLPYTFPPLLPCLQPSFTSTSSIPVNCQSLCVLLHFPCSSLTCSSGAAFRQFHVHNYPGQAGHRCTTSSTTTCGNYGIPICFHTTCYPRWLLSHLGWGQGFS